MSYSPIFNIAPLLLTNHPFLRVRIFAGLLWSLSWWRIHLQRRRPWFSSWVEKIFWRRNRLPIPVFLCFLGGSASKEPTCNAENLGLIPGLEDPLEKGEATHSSYLAWRIPWTVYSMWSQRVGRDWAIFTFKNICTVLLPQFFFSFISSKLHLDITADILQKRLSFWGHEVREIH